VTIRAKPASRFHKALQHGGEPGPVGAPAAYGPGTQDGRAGHRRTRVRQGSVVQGSGRQHSERRPTSDKLVRNHKSAETASGASPSGGISACSRHEGAPNWACAAAPLTAVPGPLGHRPGVWSPPRETAKRRRGLPPWPNRSATGLAVRSRTRNRLHPRSGHRMGVLGGHLAAAGVAAHHDLRAGALPCCRSQWYH